MKVGVTVKVGVGGKVGVFVGDGVRVGVEDFYIDEITDQAVIVAAEVDYPVVLGAALQFPGVLD